MRVQSLQLRQFRNYQNQAVTLHPQMNIFLGANAQGKTSLIESLYVLAFTKSYRCQNYRELIQFEADFAKITAQIELAERHVELTTILSKKGKKLQINGVEQQRLNEYIGQLAVIKFSPEDLELVKGQPSIRRKFLDIELSQASPAYFLALANFQRLLKQRNEYLKQTQLDEIYLDILDEALAQVAGKIYWQRFCFVKEMNAIIRPIHEQLTQKQEQILIQYQTDLGNECADFTEEHFFSQAYKKVLKKSIARDRKLQSTTTGPHKDDLQFFIATRNVKQFGSQGQQRTTVLSLKLAEIEWFAQKRQEYPILLLDDVLSELDDQRKVQLLNFINDKVQTFITTTEMHEILSDLTGAYTVFDVKDGKLFEVGETTNDTKL
ncbi:MAG: DNA replication/repair protein RecF [Culicoidibacterales bacterium]